MTLDENTLNGLAGLAALVNSLIMWPQLRALAKVIPLVKDHGERIARLETQRARPKSRRAK
jgi:hypothetical protein